MSIKHQIAASAALVCLAFTGTAAFADEHPYSEGRFQVTWRAPYGWRWPGLLPAHGGGDREWEWPTDCTVPSWCGGAELWVARQHGWAVTVHQGWLWSCSGDPLRAWQSRLLRVLALLDAELPAELARMARQAVRAILLHTVGAFHGSPRKVSHSGPDVPADALGVRLLRHSGNNQHERGRRPNLWAWYTSEQPAWPEMIHPEWSATIWGRARARLASSHRGTAGFLTLRPEQIVALRTDAIYTTEATDWPDNGDVGRYTLRGVHAVNGPWPTGGGDILRMTGRRSK